MGRYAWIVVGLATLMTMGGLFYFWKTLSEKGAVPNKYAEVTPFQVLVRENAAFRDADALYARGNHIAAEEAYVRALESVTDAVQEAQIKFKMAVNMEADGNYIEAIRRYKEIASNEAYYRTVRAYAVQAIGLLNYRFDERRLGSKSVSPDSVGELIREETFKDPPFSTFVSGSDYDPSSGVALRQLFEYASSFKPLALSEMYIAEWYATELVRLAGRDELSQENRDGYTQIIREHIAKAEAHIAEIEKDPNARPHVPRAYSRKGEIIRKLLSLDISAFSAEEGEEAFRKALTLGMLYGFREGSDYLTRYEYARFLATIFGTPRNADIAELLKVYTAENENIAESDHVFFRSSGTISNPGALQMRTRRALIEAAPSFRAYLESLGWTKEDFGE